ncbi:MAG TPA: SurA N-terminal domain-containing protein [Actinomycetes bacterium]|nr:SurA N-terminal domain-containing protein [Actinomycetes bacterium]
MTSRIRTEVPVRRLLAALAVLVLAGCAADAVTPSRAAVVNGVAIPVRSLRTEVDAVRREAGAQGLSRADLDGGRLTRLVLEQRIATELILSGARHEGVEVGEGEVDQRLVQLQAEAQASGVPFAEFLRQRNLLESTVRSQLRTDLAARRVAEHLVPGRPDAELRAELERDRDRFLQLEVRHVLVADEATARRVRTELERTGDWDRIARERSADLATRDRGGSIGVVSRGRTIPEFERAAFALAAQGGCRGRTGACQSPLSQPVRTQLGWHVLQVTAVRLPSLQEVRSQLEGSELDQRRQQAFLDWYRELAAGAEIRVNPRFGRWDRDQRHIVDAETPLRTEPPPPAAAPGSAPQP